MGMKKFLCAMLGLLFAVPSFANCNLLPVYNTSPVTVHGVTFTPQPDGSIIINGSVNDDSRYANYIVASSANKLVLPAGTYTISGITGGSSSTYILDLYGGYTSGNGDSDFFDTRAGDPITRTATSEWRLGMYAIRIMRGYTANNLVVRPMLEQGSTATPYQPYNPLCETCDGTVHSGQWNQLVQNGNFSTKEGWKESGGTITAENNTLRFVKTADGQGVVYQTYSDFIVGNKYLITAQVKGPVSADHTFGAGGGAGSSAAFSFSITNSNEYKTISRIVIPTTASNTFYFYLQGGSAGAEFDIKNVMAFNLTQMFGAGNEPATAEEAERLISVIASSLNISATDGYYAKNTGQAYSYCQQAIKIASTKYVESEFSALNTALANAVATVNTVVTQTIAQAASIATLQSGKQTRPDETCPAGKKCLLVTDENNIPHWYEICSSAHCLPEGYTELEYIQSTGGQEIDTGLPLLGTDTVTLKYSHFIRADNASRMLFGNYFSTYRFAVNFYGSETINGLFYWGNENQIGFNTPPTNDDLSHIVKFENAKIYIDNDIVVSTHLLTSNFNTGENMFIFSAGRQSFRSAYRLYYYQHAKADGQMVRDFVPAQRNSDDAVGLYDLVNKQFYTNTGFIAGPVAE